MRERKSAVWVAVLGLILPLLFCTVRLAATGGDVTEFVHFGRQSQQLPLARELLGDVATPNVDGHDGMAYWVLAHDPLLRRPAFLTEWLDRPAYRAQRLAYPLLVAPWGLGGERALLWGMLLTNLGVVGIGTYFAARLAQATALPPRAGLAFALNPGTLIAATLDLTDALALLGIVVSLYFIVRRRIGWALGAAVLAVLAKEPSLLAFGAIAVLATELRAKDRALILAVPVVALVAWGSYARSRFAPPAGEHGASVADTVRRLREVTLSPVVIAVAAGALAVVAGALAFLRSRRSRLFVPALAFALLSPALGLAALNMVKNSSREFDLPFAAYARCVRGLWVPDGFLSDEVVAVVLGVVSAVVVVRWWKRRSLALTAALPFALLFPFLNFGLLIMSMNSLRAVAPATCLLLLDAFPKERRSEDAPHGAVNEAT